MERTIQLALNRVAAIPPSLRIAAGANTAKTEIGVDLARLYHHYYLDTWGIAPPQPDPVQFEHARFLLPIEDFRVSGSTLGANTEARGNKSNELGRAFCRWILYDHFNITYFANINELIGRRPRPGFGGLHVGRRGTGDTPDYLCAQNASRVFLAEAKGRASSISFANRQFQTWRDQFSNVEVKAADGSLRSLKGFIAATRFATEANRRSLKTTLFLEDPDSPGEEPLEAAANLGQATLAVHYGRMFEKIRQPILAAALLAGVSLPSELTVAATVWTFMLGPLQGRRFIGGYYPTGRDDPLVVRGSNTDRVRLVAPSYRLDVAPGSFFGVDESIFKAVVSAVRQPTPILSEIRPLQDVEPFYSGASFLRDGSLLAPLDFLEADVTPQIY